MTGMNEQPVNYRRSGLDEPAEINVAVSDGDNVIDLVAYDGMESAVMRLDIDETLELIASLTRSIAVAVRNNARH